MYPELVVAARPASEDFWQKSGLDVYRTLTHTPFLAFVRLVGVAPVARVDIVYRWRDLATYPDDTPVLVQWAGKYRSDFFTFTVGEAKQHWFVPADVVQDSYAPATDQLPYGMERRTYG
jgi:hypothetical protein